MDEEVVLLEEQLASAEANIERLQERLAELEATAATRAGETLDLRRQLEQAHASLSQLQSLAEGRAGEIESLRAALSDAAQRGETAALRYRESVLAREPDLPADLVSGRSVEEIDASVERARQTVAQVRQHLEQQAQALRVPAGAPVRAAPDTEALSAAEKIRLGLQQA